MSGRARERRWAVGRAKQCKHEATVYTWREGHIGPTSARCSPTLGCGEWLSLGPSNDDSDSVRVEMRAAEIPGMARGVPGEISGEDEVSGWLDHFTRADIWSDEDPQKWHAGWLAHEMQDVRITTPESVNHDANAWPWDPSRPVAGQYEQWLRAAEIEATTPSRHLDGWTKFDEIDEVDDDGNPLTAFAYSPGMDDDSEPLTAALDYSPADHPLTVSIDSDGTPAVQLNGLDTAPPLLDPDEAEELGADAARQAAKDGYHGPAVVVELCVGAEPGALTMDDYDRAWAKYHPPIDTGRTIAALAEGIVEAGGILPYPGDVADITGYPDHPLTAAAYESQRASEPDCRDEDGPEVERMMTEVDVTPHEPRHCDDYIDDESAPAALRAFLGRARSPAHGHLSAEPYPKLFADHDGQRVRVVMASRLGDVGITADLDAEFGYQTRVPVEDLSNFGDAP